MSDRLFGDDVIFQQRFLKSAGLYTGRIDGIWGPLTNGACNAFLAQAEQIARELGRFDPRTERNLASLQLVAQRAARRFMVTVSPAASKRDSSPARVATWSRTRSSGVAGSAIPVRE